VSFPTSLTKPQYEAASLALASQKGADENMEDAPIVKLQKYSENQRNTHATGGQ